MILAILIALAFAAAFGGVLLFRKATATTPRLLDIPNERSLHREPVTRGAGSAIVLTVLILYVISLSDYPVNWVYVSTAITIAIVGLFDDIYSIPLLPRLLVHVTAASVLVWVCGSYERIIVPGLSGSVELGGFSTVVTVGFIVWMTNAYNFMDGIDGIAGVQGVGAGLGWMLFGISIGEPSIAALGGIIVGACFGFLLFNWQPARVFMGDVGSTFLGFTLAAMPLIPANTDTARQSGSTILAFIFVWLFLFDTVFTRLQLMVKLGPFWRPHRDHLYQKIIASGTPHQVVATFFGVFACLLGVMANIDAFVAQLFTLLLLAAGPIMLIVFARKKRLT